MALEFQDIVKVLNRVVIEQSFEKLLKQLDSKQPLWIDTETTQLYASIRLVQMHQTHWSEPLVFDTQIQSTPLVDLYSIIKDCQVIFHNISFDAACFANDLNIKEMPFKNFDDTLILAKLALYKKLESFSLDSCFELIVGYDVYEKVLKHFSSGLRKIPTKSVMQKSFVTTKTRNGLTSEITKLQIAYSALDVLLLPSLYKRCLRELPKESEWVYKLDKLFIEHAQKWQQSGIPINSEALKKEKEATEQLILSLESKLTELVGEPLNVNAPARVAKVLGISSTSKLELKTLSLQGNEIASTILKLRKVYKQQNFLERYTTKSGRVRGYFAPLTASGRAMCSGDKVGDSDNIMQIPRHLKHLIGYTENDNRYLVYADFAQLELRTACAEQGDEVLYKLFCEGKDLHKYAASQIYGIPESEVTPDQRTMAKFSNFCLLYLGSAKMFRAVVTEMGDREPPSEKECERIVNIWRNIYPGINKWHKKLKHKYIQGDLVNHTLNGRYFKAKLYTDLAAVQNQGLGAEVAKLALHYLFVHKPDIKLINFIHDSFIIEADSFGEAKEIAKLLADTMVEAWRQVTKRCKIKDLPMPTTAQIFKNLELDELFKYENKG